MAKVTMPLMSAEARGKVGGIVYNSYRGKSTVKVKKSPSQPRTARQLTIRAFATTLSRAWGSLTQLQRDGWTAYATAHPFTDWTNSPKRLTGLNFYLALGARLMDMGKAVVATAPVTLAPANVANLVATGGAGQISFAFTAYAGTATTLDIWLQGPKSAGSVGTLVKAKHKGYAPGETTPYVATALTPGLYACWARAIDEVTGLASAFIETTATVT
jgi:hypothetical protein